MLQLAQLPDFVFQLVRGQPLVVKHLADLAPVEPEVRVAEVREPHDREEQDQIRVVQLTLRFEGVVSQLVAIGFVVDVSLVFPVVAACVAAEDVDVASKA